MASARQLTPRRQLERRFMYNKSNQPFWLPVLEQVKSTDH